ncbi:MAG: SRPBCC domain-containing protein [Myxococcales bacterium]|nr:SRPBCC domain-containing protein [Myxococcales bacterium]
MTPNEKPQPVTIERVYPATIEELWALWTTKEGFEAWWGPVGFRVEVHELRAEVGGPLIYDMIAAAPEQIAAMQAMGQPISHGTRGIFAEVVPQERLVLRHVIDFLPGVAPYDNDIEVTFHQEGDRARMVVTIQPHFSAEFTKMAVAGFESQLEKLPEVLVRRRG